MWYIHLFKEKKYIYVYIISIDRFYRYHLHSCKRKMLTPRNSVIAPTLHQISALIGRLQCCKGSESLLNLKRILMQCVAESPFDTRAFRVSTTDEIKQNFRLTINGDGSAMLTRRKVIYQPSPIINRFQRVCVIPNIQRFGKSQ